MARNFVEIIFAELEVEAIIDALRMYVHYHDDENGYEKRLADELEVILKNHKPVKRNNG